MISARSYRIFQSAVSTVRPKDNVGKSNSNNDNSRESGDVGVYEWVDETCLTSKKCDEKDDLKTQNFESSIISDGNHSLETIDIGEDVNNDTRERKFNSVSSTQLASGSIDCIETDTEEDIDDDVRDKDFDLSEFVNSKLSETTESDSDSDDISECVRNDNKRKKLVISIAQDNKRTRMVPLSEQIKQERMSECKSVLCKYCGDNIATLNFARHLQRKHMQEKEVIDIMQYPKNSKARRQAFALLRNDINFDLFINGDLRPNRQVQKNIGKDSEYYPCTHCKGLYLKNYLKRHNKSCIRRSDVKPGKINHISQSQTAIACAVDPTNTISRLNVKQQVFDLMKGDEIAQEAKKDLLIVLFGESYLKKHKRERMAYVCSSKMRELSRLLISYRNLVNNKEVSLKEIFHPRNFDTVLSAVRNISGYDSATKTFQTPTLAMHLGTSLITVADELTHLILKESIGFRCKTNETDECLKNIKQFKKLIESRWNIELSSLASKHLQEKQWQKPLLVPLVSDVKKLREECLKLANNCISLFKEGKDDADTYKLLVNCSLALLIVFNRRRIGDVQFLKIGDYNHDKRTNFVDFECALSQTEKILTKQYRRVVNGGKGSRAVVILIPETIQSFINMLLEHRKNYIPLDNDYVFAIPGSAVKWGKGDVAIRSLVKQVKLEAPQAFSSNKLRKHIATVMQLLHLSQEEMKQFSSFMGHTQKTHEDFYELPIDIYQTAKISKLLLIMEKGALPVEHKGKSLAELDIDICTEYAEEDDNNDIISETPVHEPSVIDRLVLQKSSPSVSYDKSISHPNLPSCSNINKSDHQNIPINHESSNDDQNFEGSGSTKVATKKGWSKKEVEALSKEFNKDIEKKCYPSGARIKEFIKNTGSKRTVVVIKSKIQHLIKLAEK